MPNIVKTLRKISVTKVLSTNTTKLAWPTWRTAIERLGGNPPDVSSIIDLGDHLSEIFASTSISGRPQGILSGGGVAWESLVCWYLNLCLAGSRTVVVRMNKEMVPDPIRKALTVTYGSFPSNTESDLLAITFPKKDEYLQDMSGKKELHIKELTNRLDKLAKDDFTEYEVGIIQCKTNWNDNAQIPMLWDMIYRAKGFGDRSISVGIGGYSISELKKFTYSFVTVPSQKVEFKPNTTPVMRVYNLSGGNYWGKPSMKSVANSIKEILNRNFCGGMEKGLRTDLNNELRKIGTEYGYFGIYQMPPQQSEHI